MIWVWNTLITLITVIIMEITATLSHKYIMHGWGWKWHKSHHKTNSSWFETNDLYTLIFTLLTISIIYLSSQGYWPLQWIGAGMTLYGILYFIVHDGLVHQRWPLNYVPRRGYFRHLYIAHCMHHAVHGQKNSVSFGFLYASQISKLQAKLKCHKRHHSNKNAATKQRNAAVKPTPET
ncbi:beta-carotene hydroxylase (plasmid) [Pantoea sp. Nvir]|uniref:sterol desaturase family protein n=1 Tax=Pantoea sp. Nvir TaxID=2576760 RepID=UPI001358A798|nr:sterol desaturase family protein [Pantoea sp. Nvir]MXP67131.1 beta-carotene hydroxylase [Pantoea sp. Nvir]